MNLKKVVKELNKVFKAWRIDFDIKMKRLDSGREKIEATADLTLKGHDDAILACFSFFENGVAEYGFTFDKLAKTTETLTLVNEFNEEALWFKAYIDDEYLQLSHLTLIVDEDNVAEYTDRVLENLTDDDVEEYLAPLTKLTNE